MLHADVITLIAEDPEAHGVFEEYTPAQREVQCIVKSVGRSEMYQALSAGLMPEYIFTLAHDFEYQGEKLLEYKNKRYRVIRTYATEADGIDITAERINHV